MVLDPFFVVKQSQQASREQSRPKTYISLSSEEYDVQTKQCSKIRNYAAGNNLALVRKKTR